LNLAGSWLSSSAAGSVIGRQVFLQWFLMLKCRRVLPSLFKPIEKQIVDKKMAGPASSGCTFDKKKNETKQNKNKTKQKTLESLRF